MSRFGWTQFDDKRQQEFEAIKSKFEELDHMVTSRLTNGREKSLVYTKLEEAFVWCGKALRAEQLERDALDHPEVVR